MSDNSFDARVRTRVAEFLPAAFEKAFQSYHEFMKKDVSTVAKDFSEHHKAAKVAVSHIELLIKLAQRAHEPGNDSPENKQLEIMIGQAQAELAEYENTDFESEEYEDE